MLNPMTQSPAPSPATLDPAWLQTIRERVVRQAQANRLAAQAPNTLKAKVRDLRQFWGWAAAEHQLQEHYPLDPTIVLDYVLAHQQRHAPTTIRRRLATLAAEHRDRGLDNPCKHPQVKAIVTDACRARVRQGWEPRRQRALTLDLLHPILAACGDDTQGIRDRALLLLGFASGGRRPSEICNLNVEDLEELPNGDYTAALRLTKTEAGQVPRVPINGVAAEAVRAWLRHARPVQGALFWGLSPAAAKKKRLVPWSISRMIKRRAALAGLLGEGLSGHSLKASFMTEAGKQEISMLDAMALSRHKSVAVASSYYRPAADHINQAANLIRLHR